MIRMFSSIHTLPYKNEPFITEISLSQKQKAVTFMIDCWQGIRTQRIKIV